MPARRRPQLPLPGIEPGIGPIDIVIPTMDWQQIGGDMSPGTYGGTIATADGDHIELITIQPVREHVGDKEAKEVGFPFWTREAWFDVDDLDPKNADVQSALQFIGMDLDQLEGDFSPEERAIVIAEALLDYGRADEGPSGWSGDIGIPAKVKWSSGEVAGAEYLADEDEAFRDDVLGWGDIRNALEAEIERKVDQSAAEGWSQVGDLLEADLEDAGYDPHSIVIEADFGDAIAVNTDLLVGPNWAEILGYEANDLWSDVGTNKLGDWLESNGYDYLRKYGGQVPTAEGYAYGEHVIEAVAKELDVPSEVVEQVAEGIKGWQEEIPGSTSGSTYVWAKKRSKR